MPALGIKSHGAEYTTSMCGRYRRHSDKQRIAEAFSIRVGLDELYIDPEDDIAPASMQPVIRINQEGERQIERMRWGFQLPDRLLFNARSEGIERARFWKESFARRRCIVPADSFYEWQKGTSGKKPKYEFTVPGRQPFGVAGLWASWKNPKTGQQEHTFAVMTGEANQVMQPVHDRQPAILEPSAYAEYLAESDRPPLHLLRALSEEELQSKLIPHGSISEEQATLFGS